MRKKAMLQLGIYLILVMIVTLVIFAIFTNQIDLPGTVTKPESLTIRNVTIAIISDSWSLTHTYQETTNNSVYGLLNQTAQQYHFSINKTYFPGYDSFFIKAINEITNGKDNKYWQFEVNGKYANKGCNQYFLSDNDVITWKFQKSPYQ